MIEFADGLVCESSLIAKMHDIRVLAQVWPDDAAFVGGFLTTSGPFAIFQPGPGSN
jgi:hypothetical protein